MNARLPAVGREMGQDSEQNHDAAKANGVTNKAPAAAAPQSQRGQLGLPPKQGPSSTPPASTLTLLGIALDVQRKVNAFLSQEATTPLLRAVQAQVRISMGVIDEALEKYGCVPTMGVLPICRHHSKARQARWKTSS
jgi:hypothetical protein